MVTENTRPAGAAAQRRTPAATAAARRPWYEEPAAGAAATRRTTTAAAWRTRCSRAARWRAASSWPPPPAFGGRARTSAPGSGSRAPKTRSGRDSRTTLSVRRHLDTSGQRCATSLLRERDAVGSPAAGGSGPSTGSGPCIFRGGTIADDLAAHPAAVMTPEPAAAYCPECYCLLINRRTHVASRYHQQHLEGSDLDAEVVRARMARDPAFTARALRVEINPEA
ncbi:hypothetical protein V5799_005840 [Amblyomma americanum]|uniref:Uncharacterized protein n=1 Tax=Amblyomma americanum TaxID=6943 RepID=A0AAQ4DY39_AMBAM